MHRRATARHSTWRARCSSSLARSVQLTHVPYRGGGPALNDVIGGQVPLFFANVASGLGQIRSGRLRPLAVTAATRCRALPQVPTMARPACRGTRCWSGTRSWRAGRHYGRAARAARRGSHAHDGRCRVLGRVRALGGEVFNGDPAAFLKAQQVLWARVVKERGITRE